VIAAVDDALASYRRRTMNALTAELDNANELGCPLDQQGRCTNP